MSLGFVCLTALHACTPADLFVALFTPPFPVQPTVPPIPPIAFGGEPGGAFSSYVDVFNHPSLAGFKIKSLLRVVGTDIEADGRIGERGTWVIELFMRNEGTFWNGLVSNGNIGVKRVEPRPGYQQIVDAPRGYDFTIDRFFIFARESWRIDSTRIAQVTGPCDSMSLVSRRAFEDEIGRKSDDPVWIAKRGDTETFRNANTGVAIE